ncbi:MAG TPA: hypothetical protein VFU21_07245, partial [Kofleriaceae bacterium]|nr:hypothetical protein [Kofleriaceae bacterium]
MTAFTDFLRAHRGELNARFAMARRRLPALEAGAFGQFLVAAAGPLCEAVPARDASAVAHAAYDAALELCGQRLAGAGARDGRVGDAWSALLVPAAARIAEAPERALAATANALVHLAASPGARPEAWAQRMGELAARAALDEWLAAGQVAAWTAGLAHYRASALELADRLPPALALAAVGAPDASDWAEVRARLRADPWHVPARPESGTRVVARVGAFRGFGGLFPVPPTVAGGGDRFLVESDGDLWVLFADAWGATFHRAGDQDRPAGGGRAPRWRGRRVEIEGDT